MNKSDLIDFLGISNKMNVSKMGEEDRITVEIANYFRELSLIGNLKFIWFHVPNEIGNSKQFFFGAKLKAMGKINGAPDFVVLGNVGHFKFTLCLEVKATKGRLSESQKKFRGWCVMNFIDYEVVRSVEDVKVIMNEGFIRE